MPQKTTIRHIKPEPKPFVIDRVPPLAADGMNAQLQCGERIRIVCCDAECLTHPVIGIRVRGGIQVWTKEGWAEHGNPSCHIITLDGDAPADEGLVRVASLPDGVYFFHANDWWLTTNLRGIGYRQTVHVKTGGMVGQRDALLVTPLRPGERLVVTVECGE